MTKPKAILFDIGGVCVVSPMQAILDYETQNGIPKDYINFAIARTAPDGAWHKLERGEVKMDDQFFNQFRADLNRKDLWEQYHKSFKGRRTLAQSAQANATQLGDPISLKAETSSRDPTPAEGGAPTSSTSAAARSSSSSPDSALQKSYKKNMLGDPTSLKNEGSASSPIPFEQADTGYTKSSSGNSLKESYKNNMLGDPTSLKNEGSSSSPMPNEQDTGYSKSSSSIPPAPVVDSTTLFWEMMRISRQPDPHMFPALQNLVKSKQFVVGALSNTVIFPPDHPYSQVGADDPNDVRKHFDVFVSSADIGLRKPDPAIYKYAIDQLDKIDRSRGGSGVTAKDVCFLDDIGQNLKAAREVGLQTIKVNLGKVNEAVKELEQVTGLKLADEKARL